MPSELEFVRSKGRLPRLRHCFRCRSSAQGVATQLSTTSDASLHKVVTISRYSKQTVSADLPSAGTRLCRSSEGA